MTQMLSFHLSSSNSNFIYCELNSIIIFNSLFGLKYKFVRNTFFTIVFNNLCLLKFFFFYIHANVKFNLVYFSNQFRNFFNPFFSFLKLEGRGYRIYFFLNFIIGKMGYSHLCYYVIPFNVFFLKGKKKSFFKLVGRDSHLVSSVLRSLQNFRAPYVYKKKGIFVS